jgi:hypothetical protein
MYASTVAAGCGELLPQSADYPQEAPFGGRIESSNPTSSEFRLLPHRISRGLCRAEWIGSARVYMWSEVASTGPHLFRRVGLGTRRH